MKRKAIYSRATRRRQVPDGLISREDQANFWEPEKVPRLGTVLWGKTKALVGRNDRSVPAGAAVLLTLAIIGGWRLAFPPPAVLTQWDIDNAVKYTMDHTPPAPADTTIA